MRRPARATLAALAWFAALVVVFAAATGAPTVMGVAGVIAATAALLWGLLTAIAGEHRPMTEYREHVWERREADDEAEDELPYRATLLAPWVIVRDDNGVLTTDIVHGPATVYTVIDGGKRPVWPSEIGGPE